MTTGYKDPMLEALETLNRLDDLTRPRIQERLFVSRFLPMFAGLPTDVKMDEWLNIAGHPQRAVDVYRENTFLFTVPPLLRDIELKTLSGAFSVQDVIVNAKMHEENMPGSGENYKASMLKKRIVAEPPRVDELKVWGDIFSRYGVTPATPLEAPDTATGTAEPTPDDDEIVEGYDEL